MASPVADSYSTTSGQSIHAGRSNAPAWVQAIPHGEWGTMPNSTLTTSGVGWAGTHPGGTGGYDRVVTAWGGGILNTVGVTHGGVFIPGTFLVIFGGGHGDYAGNELYAYGPLESETPIWRRLTDPTIPAADDVQRIGGYPVSRHTYDTLVYLPTVNKMLCIGAPGYYHTGSAYNIADVFDFNVNPASVNPWSTRDTGFPAYNGGGVGTIALISAYNPTTGKAWGLGTGNGQKLGEFDPASDSWSSYNKDNAALGSSAPYGKGAISTTHNIFAFQGADGNVRAINLNSPSSAIYTPTVTGSAPGVGNNVLEWDATGGRFVSWDRAGKTLYFLTPGANPAAGGDAWTWTSVTPSTGATPQAALVNGTFGRFRVRPGVHRGVVLMPKADAPIYFYRM
jgi:hypothetical protein